MSTKLWSTEFLSFSYNSVIFQMRSYADSSSESSCTASVAADSASFATAWVTPCAATTAGTQAMLSSAPIPSTAPVVERTDGR